MRSSNLIEVSISISKRSSTMKITGTFPREAGARRAGAGRPVKKNSRKKKR